MTTVVQVLTPLRQHIRDSSASSGSLYHLVRLALHDLFADIPEAAIQDDGSIAHVPATLANDTDPLPADPMYIRALASRAAYHYYLGDIGSTRNQNRANDFAKDYNRLLFGTDSTPAIG